MYARMCVHVCVCVHVCACVYAYSVLPSYTGTGLAPTPAPGAQKQAVAGNMALCSLV